ncbi:conserved exported hypothetical protein [Paraburkholderia tropica]|uniref:hypothetical protein n=1 Tax=Paraburkholderia TaxID=1822464 RepID=UPI001CAB59B7|nr:MULTISPECIES: hypothetical protein [Paraburkholderia]CAG9202090.1 conserved exported hypothetical protein [Paraburkholderia tropica]
MRHLIVISTLAVAACAAPAPDTSIQSLGQSAHPPAAVAQCIAANWANSSGQTVYMQHVLANGTAFDVYAPGQQPPGGTAAVVRPAMSGPGSSVGLRGSGGNAAGSVNTCL